jgi:F-type H+-transporting ATPase subunit alpha
LGVLPAVDVSRSVSRVGGKAQRGTFRQAAGDLKLAYAQFEELETFVRFGARLDEASRRTIEHGRRIRACLKQPEFSPVPALEQLAVFLALTVGYFEEVPVELMGRAELAVREAAARLPEAVKTAIMDTDPAECRQVQDSQAAVRALAVFRSPSELSGTAGPCPKGADLTKPRIPAEKSAAPENSVRGPDMKAWPHRK